MNKDIKNFFPADIRPQGHDIIRTWAFYTIVKAWSHFEDIPWKDILLSGWILDPDRKKMSKSKNNVITPQSLFDQYSSDAIRYWAGRAKLGTDTAVDESVFKIGIKLTTKLFNAAKFVLMQFERVGVDPQSTKESDISEELDLSFINNLKGTVEYASKNFDNQDYAAALLKTEESFWDFCDNYLELVKVRSYSDEDNSGRRSALASLSWSLKTFLRLFAPFIPYVTEEIWQEAFNKEFESVHTAKWPCTKELDGVSEPASETSYQSASEVIGKIRGAKTREQKSLKWEVEELNLTCSDDYKDSLNIVLEDLLKAGNVKTVEFKSGEASEGYFDVSVKLSQNWSK